MKKRLKATLAVCTVAAMMTGLAACGAETEQKENQTEDTKKVMNLGSTGYFASSTMDPAFDYDGWYMMYNGTTETLFKLDENIAPQPWLATSCETTDNINWTVTLRDNVTFQNGEKMTGEAVKKCFERTFEENSRAKDQIAIASLEADGQDLIFHLEKESVALMNDLCDPLWSVYDSENSDYEENLYCTGPYMITEFEPFAETVVEKYDGYWGGEPKLDEAHLITIDDTEALTMALQSGEIDMAVAMPTSAISTFAEDDHFVVDSVVTTRENYIDFNMERPLMQDDAVRQAIAMSIDRDSIASAIYSDMAEPSWGIFPDIVSFGGTEGIDLKISEYDPEGAAKVLEEAGWADTDGDGILDKDGQKLELSAITFSSRKELGQVLELIQSDMAEMGVSIQVQSLENFAEIVEQNDYDMVCNTGVLAPTGNPQYLIDIMLTTGASNNYANYSDPKVDELAEQLSGTSGEEERADLVKQITQIVLDDNSKVVYNHQMFTNVYTKDVTNFSTHPSEYYLLDVNTDLEK